MTDGRASKSFIRHLKRRWERFKQKSQMRSELKAKEEPSNHLDIVDLSESVLAPAEPATGVLKLTNLSEHHMVSVTMDPSPNKLCSGAASYQRCAVFADRRCDFVILIQLSIITIATKKHRGRGQNSS